MQRRIVDEKVALIDAWRSVGEGKTQRQFCVESGLHPPTFCKWLSQESRLRETVGAKKNAQRASSYPADTDSLQSFVRSKLSGRHVTVPEMLAFAERERLLQHSNLYITRYMFCRRILIDYVAQHPLAWVPTPLVGADEEQQEGQDEDGGEHEGQDVGGQDEEDAYPAYVYVNSMIFSKEAKQAIRVEYGRCICVDDCNARCLNRVCAEDCSVKNCSLKGRCTNRWVDMTAERRFEIFDTHTTGWGLRSRGVLPEGKVVLQYCGEYITVGEYSRRCRHLGASESYYYMECDSKFGVDARKFGSLARFVNHSCIPNLKTVKRIVDGTTRVFFVTAREIRAREEVTISYGDTDFTCVCVACIAAM